MLGFTYEERLPTVDSNVPTQTQDQTNNRARLKTKHPAYWSMPSLKIRKILKWEQLISSAGRGSE